MKMINETLSSAANNCSTVYNFVDIVANSAVGLYENGNSIWLITFAFIGLVSIIAAVGEKAIKGLQYMFMFFVAIPLIIIVGLINKKNRRERLKELGDIKSHLKQHPERWKSLLFIILLILIPIFIYILIRSTL